MTPEYIASKLSLLPQFKVEVIDHEPEKYGRGKTLLGRFSEPPLLDGKDYRASFFLPDLRDICGRLHEGPDSANICLFQQHENWTSKITDAELLTETITYFGHYDKNHIELALDPAISWSEDRVPPDTSLEKVRFEDQDGKTHFIPLECFKGEPLPKGSTIIESDWSHRHCSFCWERTESGEIGYVGNSHPEREDLGKDWVCTWCFRNAVQPHDLRPLLIPRAARVQIPE
jgi:hypothetical protein